MIVLHGIWADSTFHLWGERSSAESTEPGASALADECPAAALTHPSPSSVAWHPMALDPHELHAVLGELSPDGLLASIAGDLSIDLWLPCVAQVPLSSTDYGDGGAQPGANGEVELAAFRVPTLALGPAEAIDLLVSMPQPPPRICGDSIRYWSWLARYLSTLVTRKQFVPNLEQRADGVCLATWRVLVHDRKELGRLQRFAGVMPPVCRAVVAAAGEQPDAAALVEGFLQSCVDAVIRRALTEDPFFSQIHERAAGNAPWEVRWLSALMGDDHMLRGADLDRVAFINQLRGWVGRLVEDGSRVPTKLCFVLNEPEDEGDGFDPLPVALTSEIGADDVGAGEQAARRPWRLRFFLKSLDGTGRLHDIAAAWADQGTAPTILRRHLASGREHLIGDLTAAAEVFPPIGDSLKTEAPSGIDLTVMEAHAFMRDSAPLLEARGFAVRLPDWVTRKDRQVGLRLFITPGDRETGRHSGAVTDGGMGLASMVDFEWRIAVGDSQLTIEEFERLRARQAPLVRLGGEWIHLDADAAQRAAKFIERERHGRMTLGQAIRAATGAADLDIGLPVVGLNATSWIEQLLDESARAKIEPVEQPKEFRGTMRPYQLRGLEWMVFMQRLGIGACLADDMGLGKTIQLIALLLDERARLKNVGPTLIFAPMSVVGNWEREIERFGAGLKVLVHHGPERLTGDAFAEAVGRSNAAITTYALGNRDFDTLRLVPWHRIVLDEAQKIKNPSAAQTIAIRSLPSTYRVALTGTPLENHLSELWSIMEMLNPGLLGSAGDFRKRFAVPIERLGDAQRAEQLKRMIQPFILRRVKSDPNVECDLPEKMEMRVFCNLTAEQAALYERIVAETLGEVETATGIRRRGVILAALTRLKQICNHPCHYLGEEGVLEGRSGKCERLVEMLEEAIAEGDAALVFTQFRKMGDLLVKMLTERLHTEVLFLHGGSSAKQRQAMVDRFQNPDGGIKIFLLSLRAGGLGLNLTSANHVFHFDRWWNPAVEAQATDRAYRIGQTRRVQVHKFVCIGTIEDRIDRMLTEKLALADRIVGSGDDWLTGLSTEELREYLTLSRDVVGES